MNPGDCLYIPAYFYVQSKTTADLEQMDNLKSKVGESIMITWQFDSHSAIVDVMLDALESEVLTDELPHMPYTSNIATGLR